MHSSPAFVTKTPPKTRPRSLFGGGLDGACHSNTAVNSVPSQSRARISPSPVNLPDFGGKHTNTFALNALLEPGMSVATFSMAKSRHIRGRLARHFARRPRCCIYYRLHFMHARELGSVPFQAQVFDAAGELAGLGRQEHGQFRIELVVRAQIAIMPKRRRAGC